MKLHTNRSVFWVSILVLWVVLFAGLIVYAPGGLQYRSNYSFDELVDDGVEYAVVDNQFLSYDTIVSTVGTYDFYGTQTAEVFSTSSTRNLGGEIYDFNQVRNSVILRLFTETSLSKSYEYNMNNGIFSEIIFDTQINPAYNASCQWSPNRLMYICIGNGVDLTILGGYVASSTTLIRPQDLLALATEAGVPQRTHTGKVAEYGDRNYYIQSLEWLDDETVLVTTTEDSDSTQGGYNDHFIIYDITTAPRVEYQPQLRGCAEPNYINETLYCTLGYNTARIEGKINNWLDVVSRPVDQVLISQKLDQPASTSYKVVNPLPFPPAHLGYMNDRYLGAYGSRYFTIFDLATGKRKQFDLLSPMHTGKPMTHEQTTVFGPTSPGGVEATYEYESVYRLRE